MADAVEKTRVARDTKKHQMSMVNYQCVMCGWSFKWPCGDDSGVGSIMYAVESVYYKSRPSAFPSLFNAFEGAHVVHKHGRKAIDTSWAIRTASHTRNPKFGRNNVAAARYVDVDTRDRDLLDDKESWFGERVKALLPSLEVNQVMQNENMRNLMSQVFLQLCWVLDTAMVSHGVFSQRVGNAQASKDWLEQRFRSLSTTKSMNWIESNFWNNWKHCTCDKCNLDQTRTLKFWAVVSAMVGVENIGQSGQDGSQEMEDEEIGEEDMARAGAAAAGGVVRAGAAAVGADGLPIRSGPKRAQQETNDNRELMIALIVTNTELQVKRFILDRYGWDSGKEDWHEPISAFINFLTVMNLQTSTMCVHDATTLKTMSGEHKKGDSALKRCRWQAAAAVLSTATLNRCFLMIDTLAFQWREENQPNPYTLHTELEILWKFVVVECAAFKLVDPTTTPPEVLRVFRQRRGRKFNISVFEYIFEHRENLNAFDDTTAAFPGAYLSKVSSIIKHGFEGTTKFMTDSRGTSIMMLLIRNMRPTEARADLLDKVLSIPAQQEEWSVDMSQQPHTAALNFSTDVQVLDAAYTARTGVLHQKMRLHTLPEYMATEMTETLYQSELGDTASPSDVVKRMRARTFQEAVAAMVRLPYILNDMAPDPTRVLVRKHLDRLMRAKDPLARARYPM